MATAEAPRKRRGRAPFPKEEKQEILCTRVRPRFLRVLEAEAEEDGISLSEAARYIIETWAATRARLEADGEGAAVKDAIAYGRQAAEALNEAGLSYEEILALMGQVAREALAAEERKARSRRSRPDRTESKSA